VWMHQPSSYPRNTATVSHCTCDACACHGAELTSVFHSAAYANASFTTAEQELSMQAMQLWAGFAHNAFDTAASKYVFPVYNAQSDNALLLDIGQPWEVASGWRSEYCDFWDQLGVFNY
jgi:carboxylesterase type B